VAGCGEQEGGEGSAGKPASELTITLDRDGPGGEPVETAELSCPGSEHCAALGDLSAVDLGPVDPRQACTEIYGGPDLVTIEGELGGDPVETTLTRGNGCEIERFEQVVELLEALFPGYEPGSAIT
jgi:hypothetical protein